jgi:hypothetical protein
MQQVVSKSTPTAKNPSGRNHSRLTLEHLGYVFARLAEHVTWARASGPRSSHGHGIGARASFDGHGFDLGWIGRLGRYETLP